MDKARPGIFYGNRPKSLENGINQNIRLNGGVKRFEMELFRRDIGR
jgi:hypothetical protein